MGHCRIHGHYPDSWTSCHDCERAEESRLEALEAIREQVEEAEEAAEARAERAAELAEALSERQAYLVNNPGDFDCPACRLRSLKRNARRCPKCRESIEQSYWEQVESEEARQRELVRQRAQAREREKAIAREAHEAWLSSPAGRSAAAAEAKKRHDEAAAIDSAQSRRQFVDIVVATVAAIVGGFVGMFAGALGGLIVALPIMLFGSERAGGIALGVVVLSCLEIGVFVFAAGGVAVRDSQKRPVLVIVVAGIAANLFWFLGFPLAMRAITGE